MNTLLRGGRAEQAERAERGLCSVARSPAQSALGCIFLAPLFLTKEPAHKLVGNELCKK